MRGMPLLISAATAQTHCPVAVAPTHAPVALHVPVAATPPHDAVAAVLSHVPAASQGATPSLLEIYHQELSDPAATVHAIPDLLSDCDDASADEDVGSNAGSDDGPPGHVPIARGRGVKGAGPHPRAGKPLKETYASNSSGDENRTGVGAASD
jgi:hypothetical protein